MPKDSTRKMYTNLKTDLTGGESPARYECPRKCANSRSTKPGNCPTCSMSLEKKS